MTILLASIIDASILLGMALVAVVALRGASAALRHAVLAAAILLAVSAPVLEWFVPQLPVIRWYDQTPALSSGLTLTSGDEIALSPDGGRTATREGIPWPALLLSLWVAGAGVTCAGLVTSLLRLSRLTARCTPVRDGPWRGMTDELSHALRVPRRVELLQSPDPSMLVTCGWLRPRIILPSGSADWTDDRMRVVLIHELAHVRRRDGAMQLAGEALRVMHWFNPLVWASCRRLRQESEFACDDAVLREGVEAHQYATHLLELARHVSGQRHTWVSAPAIAHPSTLERRVVAMLNPECRRDPLTGRALAAVLIAALAIGVPMTAAGVAAPEVTVTTAGPTGDAQGDRRLSPIPLGRLDTARSAEAAAQREAGSIVGSVLDQSGGAMPGARLTVIDTQAGVQYETVTDSSGRFAFRDLQPARYELVARLAGFASVTNVLPLTSGAAIERIITLPLGTLQEMITVACGPEPRANGAASVLRILARMFVPVLSAQAPPATPIRVGGNVQPPRKLTDVAPACPTTTVPTTDVWVRLTGRVGVDGFVNDAAPLPSEPGTEPPMEFVESALDAVRRWQFTPTLLNGRPVDVTITVQVLFRAR